MNRCVIMSVMIVGLCSITAMAAPTVDGTLDASYGAAIAVQGVSTGFGDANPPVALNGSELDAGYATISGGRLYLMLTGNLEPNFNKLEVFFDSKAGGENVMTSTPQYDYTPDGGTTWNSQNMHGMTFDSGFTADYHLYARWGGNNVPGQFEVDFVNRNGGAVASVPGSSGKSVDNPTVGGIAIGTIPAGNLAVYNLGGALTSALSQNLDFAINDNNTAGVTGGAPPFLGADTAAAAAATTGMEFSIALADLGNPAPGSTIKIAAMINNSDHNYLSNQTLGTLPLSDPTDPPSKSNLGGNGFGAFTGDLSGIDFNTYAGLQYFTIAVPGIPGDYNGNGVVDAADYAIWRDTLGSTTDLRANGDNTGASAGKIDQADYTYWKSRFGNISGSGSLSGGAVPEPTSIVLMVVGILMGGRLLSRKP